jgi:hypothetical protein
LSGLETATMLLIEMICGAAGAIAVARLWRSVDLGWKSIAFIGMLGGLALTLLAANIPGLGRFVGHVASAADASSRGVGGLTPAVLIGVGIAGLLGGVISISLVGLARRVHIPGR